MTDLGNHGAPQGKRAPRFLAQRTSLVVITGKPEASMKSPSGLRTRACAFNQVPDSSAAVRPSSMAPSSSVRPVPKVIPEEIKDRIVELLRQGAVAPDIIRSIAQEFDGFKISRPTVTRLAPRAGVALSQGRPEGSKDAEPRSREPQDPDLREKAEAALGEEGSLRKAAKVLGISYERVRQLTTDDK